VFDTCGINKLLTYLPDAKMHQIFSDGGTCSAPPYSLVGLSFKGHTPR